MSDRFNIASTFSVPATTRSLSSAAIGTAQPIKVIDVSERPAVANVIRDGRQVPAVTTNPTQLQSWLDIGIIRPIEDTRRVVTQSIPAGTRVARGASVDLLMAEPRLIPVQVLDRPHIGIVEFNYTVEEVLNTYLTDAEIRTAVLDADSATTLAPAMQTRLRNLFAERNSPIDDGDPQRDLGAAFRTLKSAAAFR
jgi:hypothetical protein